MAFAERSERSERTERILRHNILLALFVSSSFLSFILSFFIFVCCCNCLLKKSLPFPPRPFFCLVSLFFIVLIIAAVEAFGLHLVCSSQWILPLCLLLQAPLLFSPCWLTELGWFRFFSLAAQKNVQMSFRFNSAPVNCCYWRFLELFRRYFSRSLKNRLILLQVLTRLSRDWIGMGWGKLQVRGAEHSFAAEAESSPVSQTVMRERLRLKATATMG